MTWLARPDAYTGAGVETRGMPDRDNATDGDLELWRNLFGQFLQGDALTEESPAPAPSEPVVLTMGSDVWFWGTVGSDSVADGQRHQLGQHRVSVSSETRPDLVETPEIASTSSETGPDMISDAKALDAVWSAFQRAQFEPLEAGMDSLFSREIEQLVHAFGESALRPIESAVAVPHTSQEVLAEALITLGRLIDPVTHQGRLRLLLRQLRSESAWVRDGALQGLSWMEDASAVAGLRRAAKVESIRELRANIEVVISELGEVDECLWS